MAYGMYQFLFCASATSELVLSNKYRDAYTYVPIKATKVGFEDWGGSYEPWPTTEENGSIHPKLDSRSLRLKGFNPLGWALEFPIGPGCAPQIQVDAYGDLPFSCEPTNDQRRHLR